ncbi:VOC family protein [Streptomyces sp. NPDC059828]|uniref:VOC family protein n=1 Tax=Streptomyces sp. NPDC059828 TaxID=3346965 RepID=UPI0036561337
MAVQPVPEGYTTVTPWIICNDTAGLVDYLQRAFDAEELGRFEMEDGTIGHVELRIGDARVMGFDSPKGWPVTPAFLRLYVPDAKETHRRAVGAGGESVTEVTLQFFGDEGGRVRDPFGNIWWIQSHVEDVDEAETERRLGDPKFTGAMEYAVESLVAAGPRLREDMEDMEDTTVG